MPTPAYCVRNLSPLALIATALFLLSTMLLAGCKHCMPTINANMNMKADARTVSEPSTPGNAGPVHAFTVPKQDAEMGGP
jgi:hypothetical protein